MGRQPVGGVAVLAGNGKRSVRTTSGLPAAVQVRSLPAKRRAADNTGSE